MHVQLVRKIGRLESKEEPAHRIVLVEDVACPDVGLPRTVFIASLQVDERVGIRALIVARVEIERIAAVQVDSRAQTAAAVPLRGQGILPVRRVRLITSVEIAIAVVIIEILGLEPARRGAQLDGLDGFP